MSLSNSSISDQYSLANTHYAWSNQVYTQDLHIDYSISGNRLHKRIDGTLEVMPKPVGVVLGEWVLRPLIDATYNISTQTFQIIGNGFFPLSNFLTSPINFFPGAQASPTEAPFPPSENADPMLCPALRALKSAGENIHADSLQLHRPKDSPNNDHDDFSQDDDEFSSPEEAQKYLEERMGKVNKPTTNCLAENEIVQIKDIKKPNPAQKQILKKAYALIQLLAKEDHLVLCNQRVLELLNTIYSDSYSYSIDALHPLPELLASLLNMKGGDYTSNDLDLLVTKINEISRKMTVQLRVTNDQIALVGWIDVMLRSAAKNPHLLISTYEIALKVLHSNATIKWEQKRELRNMARWHQKNPISQEEQVIANKILDITGSQIALMNAGFSYLECIPDDIKRLNELAQDIRSILFSSATFREMTALIIGLLAFRTIPTDYKNIATLITLSAFLTRILSHYPQNSGNR